MEFESSDRNKKAPQSHVCVIYDPRDGRIVHGHIFVGDGTGLYGPQGKVERERETLEGARRNHGDVSRFKTLHAPSEFRFAPNTAYRVDVKAGRLVERAVIERRESPRAKPTAAKRKAPPSKARSRR